MNNPYFKHAPLQRKVGLCLRNLSVIKVCNKEYRKSEVIIAITLHNQKNTIRAALSSALAQTLVKNYKARIVVLDDQSVDAWQKEVSDLLQHPSVTLVRANAGSAARARNAILDYAEKDQYAIWTARLDADDELATPQSVEALWKEGIKQNASYVIGSNLLKKSGELQDFINIADPEILLSSTKLNSFIEAFCSGKQEQELPSCNLLLRTDITLRYPNVRSAEDHWLLIRLLTHYTEQAAIVPNPIYAVYSLNGNDTKKNRKNDIWKIQRKRLAEASKCWFDLKQKKVELLGIGLEGAVWLQEKTVIKRFYSWAINDQEVKSLESLLNKDNRHLPRVKWFKEDGHWHYKTSFVESRTMKRKESLSAVKDYLLSLYRAGICTSNIKRDNMLVTKNGELFYIDIGKDIKPLSSSRFIDMAARLYSIVVLGFDDEELVRRKTLLSESQVLDELAGFANFYKELIMTLHSNCIQHYPQIIKPKYKADNVTLLIKCCAQDAEQLVEQVSHITTQLQYPVEFKEIHLLIDPYKGPFLREYTSGNYELLLEKASQLKVSGVIQKISLAPEDKDTIQSTYRRWFSQDSVIDSHTNKKAPLFPQIWSFDQINTPYVLQCDCDILIGRKSLNHDYLSDMLNAIVKPNVLCVGFNIPKSRSGFNPYFGMPGQFAPEVRFGLLDLNSIKQQLPIYNPIENNKFTLTWHRALQKHQAETGLVSLRGGDSESFYIHPQNKDKHYDDFHKIRDLIAQGIYPDIQAEQFDLVLHEEWQYPKRSEEIVFLLKGRNTSFQKLQRCLDSLVIQTNQAFGIVLIDDHSGHQHSWCYPLLLNDKTTLIRREKHHGRMPNFIEAIEEVCTDPNTLVVVLDQDDCLMHNNVVTDLYDALREGYDLIQMPIFRPNKPLKLYQPNYEDPRNEGGANVWSHLRAFKKSLFEKVPKDHFKHDGQWFDTVTDYATMLPMVELAQKPLYLDKGYAYYHDREDYSKEKKEREHHYITTLINKPSLKAVLADTMQLSDEFQP